jgi:hypothetical protein
MPQYDPKQVSISWNAISLNQGIAAGTFILAERVTPDWVDEVGSDGEYLRIAQNDERGIVTVTLMQSSKVNGLLSAVLKVDKLTAGAVGGMTIKDNQGNSLAIGAVAFIEGPPPMERSNAATTNAWRFLCSKLDITQLGNADIPLSS